MSTTRTVIYDRVSVKDPGSQTEHIKRCRAYAESQGWEVVAERTDTASGFKTDTKRPGWDAVAEMVKAGEVDAVVVFAVSRAGRNIVKLFQFVELCKDHDVTFASATEPISTAGDYGLIFIAILGALAQMESATKRERALVGMETAEREGTWRGGHRPYGFQPVPTTTSHGEKAFRLEVDESEARHVREAAEVLLNGGSLNAVAGVLNAAGSRMPSGRKWTAVDVPPMLDRDLNVPAIFPAATLRKVRKAIEARRDNGTRRPKYLLTGLVTCAICGGKLGGKPVAGIPKYICTATGSLHLSVRAADLEEEVGQACSNMVIDKPEAIPDPGQVPEELAAELREIEGKLEALGEQVENGQLSEAAFRGRERKLSARGEELQQKIDALASQTSRRFSELLDPGDDADPAELRAWIESLTEDIVVYPGRTDRVQVYAREGVKPV